MACPLAFLTLIRQMSRLKKGLAVEEDEDVKKRSTCCNIC